jgi:uncharacterized protein YkwD
MPGGGLQVSGTSSEGTQKDERSRPEDPLHMRLATIRRIRLAGIAVVAACLIAPAQALACSDAGANPHDISLREAKRATLCLLNEIRRDHDMRRLRHDRRLSRASQRHTRAMTRRNFFAHGDFVGRIRSAGFLRGARGWTVGENIAWGSWDYATPRSIVHGWMNSPPHRANILSTRFREIGIGVSRGAPRPGQNRAATYATDFGTRY